MKKKYTPKEIQILCEEKGYPYVAMDSDGRWWGYRDRPKRISQVWIQCLDRSYSVIYILDNKHLKIKYSGSWKDSLVVPEDNNKEKSNMKFKIWDKSKETKASKEWVFDTGISTDGDFEVRAVDSETGDHVCYLLAISSKTGKVAFHVDIRISLSKQGYNTQGLDLDDDGRLVRWER